MGFKPYSEQSFINIDGLDYPCTYNHRSKYSWSGVLNFRGRTIEAKGATRTEVERLLRKLTDD